ncbi:MAG: TVP38/TMEM64 family protein [Acetobacteraceae bacterium]|nr:TVP38/TMEM64 family protein [Acetobacteraceae bacterium]
MGGTAKTTIRVAAGLLLLAVMVGGFLVARSNWTDAAQLVAVVTRMAHEAGPAGWAGFALAQAAVAMIGVIPASLLGLAAGAVYGLFMGFALAAIGTLIGGWLAFRLARSLLRPWVERLLARRAGGRLDRLSAEVERDGWRFVCLLRISPVMPFALTSYALGLSPISGRDYLLGTLAALPALAGYVAVGALARHGLMSVAEGSGLGVLNWALYGFGAVATLLLIFRSGTFLARVGLLPGTAAGKS